MCRITVYIINNKGDKLTGSVLDRGGEAAEGHLSVWRGGTVAKIEDIARAQDTLALHVGVDLCVCVWVCVAPR